MRTDTLHTKIAGEHARVKVAYEFVNADRITMRVASREDALLACFCHRTAPYTKIERAADGGWLVVVYNKAV